MREADTPSPLDRRLADRLKTLRLDGGLTLDALAEASGVSRATLSRLENAETSATAAVLGRLCAVHGLTLSRLMTMVEDGYRPLVRAEEQLVWTDPETGFERRVVSPPAAGLDGEAMAGRLPSGRRLTYDAPPRPGLEHHLVMLEGALALTVGGETHRLAPGDCLRFRLDGPSTFETGPDAAARYLLFLV